MEQLVMQGLLNPKDTMDSGMSEKKEDPYEQIDVADRDAHLISRNDVLDKSFAVDLWVKVISRAINDIILYEYMQETGKELTEEEEELKASALGFLFSDEHYIHLDDYIIDIHCRKCEASWEAKMSHIAGQRVVCPECKNKSSWKNTEYEVSSNYPVREISFADLIALWGIEDVEKFRKDCHQRIETAVQAKLRTEQKRTESLKRKELQSFKRMLDNMTILEDMIQSLQEIFNRRRG